LRIGNRDWALIYPSIKWQKSPRTPQLFHLATDPMQKKNVLRKNIDLARKMWDECDKWFQASGCEIVRNVNPRP